MREHKTYSRECARCCGWRGCLAAAGQPTARVRRSSRPKNGEMFWLLASRLGANESSNVLKPMKLRPLGLWGLDSQISNVAHVVATRHRNPCNTNMKASPRSRAWAGARMAHADPPVLVAAGFVAQSCSPWALLRNSAWSATVSHRHHGKTLSSVSLILRRDWSSSVGPMTSVYCPPDPAHQKIQRRAEYAVRHCSLAVVASHTIPATHMTPYRDGQHSTIDRACPAPTS